MLPVSVLPIPFGLKRPIPALEALLFRSADCWNTSIVALAILSSRLFISATEPEPWSQTWENKRACVSLYPQASTLCCFPKNVMHIRAFINILTGSFKHCLIINWSSSQDCLSVHCSRFWGKWSQHVKNTKHVLKCKNPLQYSLSQKNRGMITHNKGIDMTQKASKSITYTHHRDKGKNSDIKIMCLTQLGIGNE